MISRRETRWPTSMGLGRFSRKTDQDADLFQDHQVPGPISANNAPHRRTDQPALLSTTAAGRARGRPRSTFHAATCFYGRDRRRHLPKPIRIERRAPAGPEGVLDEAANLLAEAKFSPSIMAGGGGW